MKNPIKIFSKAIPEKTYVGHLDLKIIFVV